MKMALRTAEGNFCTSGNVRISKETPADQDSVLNLDMHEMSKLGLISWGQLHRLI